MYRKAGSSTPVSSRNGGFTLLETLIALAIISGVLVTVLVTLDYHIDATGRIRAMTTATLLAREKVEDITINGLPVVSEGDFAPAFPGFKWQYYTEDLSIPGIKKVYLTVTWGRNNRVLIETYVQA